jgi:hypothetical protein
MEKGHNEIWRNVSKIIKEGVTKILEKISEN